MQRLQHLAAIVFVVIGSCFRTPLLCAALSTSRGTFMFSGGLRATSIRPAQYLPNKRRPPLSLSAVVDPSLFSSVLASSSDEGSDGASLLAEGLGYLVGAGSFLLYTPIAVRIFRQKRADGLTLNTWWLKLASYTCSDVYAFTRGYPLSTYVETLVITAEALILLLLVAHFQKSIDFKFYAAAFVFGVCAVLLLNAPPEIIALGQGGSALLNAGALVPQFLLNAELQKAGDYSPITAALASGGCAIRLFTTIQLAGADPILMGTYGLAFLLNAGLFAQILWYGVIVEGRDVLTVLSADIGSTAEIDDTSVLLSTRDPSE